MKGSLEKKAAVVFFVRILAMKNRQVSATLHACSMHYLDAMLIVEKWWWWTPGWYAEPLCSWRTRNLRHIQTSQEKQILSSFRESQNKTSSIKRRKYCWIQHFTSGYNSWKQGAQKFERKRNNPLIFFAI